MKQNNKFSQPKQTYIRSISRLSSNCSYTTSDGIDKLAKLKHRTNINNKRNTTNNINNKQTSINLNIINNKQTSINKQTINELNDPNEDYSCKFSLPSNSEEKVYIFGDIEGHNNIFESTIETINSTIKNENNKYIFLGDIYDYAKPKESISQVSQILSALNIESNYPFNEETKEIDVIRAFRKLWKTKQLKCYSKYNIQYLHSKPKRVNISSERYLFILGNKEVIFIQEIITSERISKNNEYFVVPADYKRKKRLPGEPEIKHTEYNFTVEELNIMYSYLSLCYNFAVIDGYMFIHCYINYKLFMNDLISREIKHIISGHSKGYGHFIDSDFKKVDVYILDLTGIVDNVNNYMTLTKEGVKYNYNSNFKPVLEKLSFHPQMENIDITSHPMMNSELDDLILITNNSSNSSSIDGYSPRSSSSGSNSPTEVNSNNNNIIIMND